jgi:hypothetical protein
MPFINPAEHVPLCAGTHSLFSQSRNIRTKIQVSEMKGRRRIGKKGKAIPVTGCGDPYGCETSRLPHFPHGRLTGGGEVVSLTRRSPFTRRDIPDTHFC